MRKFPLQVLQRGPTPPTGEDLGKQVAATRLLTLSLLASAYSLPSTATSMFPTPPPASSPAVPTGLANEGRAAGVGG